MNTARFSCDRIDSPKIRHLAYWVSYSLRCWDSISVRTYCKRIVLVEPSQDYSVSHPKTYFCFFSAGLRIWKEHSRLSSTLIMAPALSNSPQ